MFGQMRRHLLFLIGLAFAVRCLVPVGFMLAASPVPGGMPEIIICTSHGMQYRSLDEKGVPHPEKSGADQKSACPYAPVGAASANEDAQHLLTHTVRYASVAYTLATEIFRATPKPGAHSARGPPAHLI
jgi:hypothetical protein